MKALQKSFIVCCVVSIKQNVQMIFAEGVSEDGLGLAVMNRLRKAADYKL